jgi:hypothetical protein
MAPVWPLEEVGAVCEHPVVAEPATQRSWAPTRIQLAAAAVGVAIALGSLTAGPPAAGALRLLGYPTACAAIARWVPIVRNRRRDWLLAHEAAMASICLGWALSGRWSGVIINGVWGVSAAVWWAVGGRRANASVPDGS